MIRINQNTIREAIRKNVRLDGRDFLNYRVIKVSKDNFGTCVELGNTVVYVSSKLTLDRIEMQKIVLISDASDKWLLKSIEQCIDMESLMITKEVGWRLELKLQTVQNDGNLLDALVIGILSQLLSIKKFHVTEDLRIVQSEERLPTSLQLLYFPISITLCFIDEHIVLDPISQEMELAKGVYSTIVNEHDEICAFVPIKTMKMDIEQLQSILKLSIEKARDIRNHVRKLK
eukprot:NODE_184_length_15718_cov_0.161342.p8 type:complete len:231 gc:universal NODE_184_length_15718_cov_0.161342:8363-9055(+)